MTQFSYNLLTISSHAASLPFRTTRIADLFAHIYGRGFDKRCNLALYIMNLV